MPILSKNRLILAIYLTTISLAFYCFLCALGNQLMSWLIPVTLVLFSVLSSYIKAVEFKTNENIEVKSNNFSFEAQSMITGFLIYAPVLASTMLKPDQEFYWVIVYFSFSLGAYLRLRSSLLEEQFNFKNYRLWAGVCSVAINGYLLYIIYRLSPVYNP